MSTSEELEEVGVFEDTNIDDEQPEENGDSVSSVFDDKTTTDKQVIDDLESKVCAHETEIILLKAALSDALTRLHVVEEELKKSDARPPTKKDSTSAPAARTATPLRKPRPKSLVTTTPHVEPARPESRKSLSSTSAEHKPKTKSKKSSLSSQKEAPKESPIEIKDDGKPKIILARKAAPSSPKKLKQKTPSQEDSLTKDEVMKFFIRGRGLNLYPPSGYQGHSSHDGEAPEQKLHLNWVYGYRGKDCRDNLFYLPTGELVYNVAGVVILYDTNTKVQRHYTEHTDDVKCISLHPDNVLIASGQVAGHGDEDKKPHVLVWDSTTLETRSSFGHKTFERGLCVVKFTAHDNGKYVVCMDDSNDHAIYVYDWEKQVLLVDAKGSKDPVLGAKWSPTSGSNFSTYGKGHLAFWTLSFDPVSITKKAAIYESIPKPKFVQSVVYTNDGDLVSGDSNGNILLFKPDKTKVGGKALGAHVGGVFCLLFLETKEAILSSGRDGQFSLWSKSLEKLADYDKITEQYGPARCITFNSVDNVYYVGTAKNCLLQFNEDLSEEEAFGMGHHDEMWGLATHPTLPLVATCAQDHLVCVWDSEKKSNVWNYNIEKKGECAEFHPTLDYVLVGTTCGSICFLNFTTFEEDLTIPVSREVISDIKVSPNGKMFAAACRDTKIYLYSWPEDDVTSIGKPSVMKGHASRVLHLDWSSDSEYLQSNSSDYELLFWHAEYAQQIVSPSALRDVSWATWTCPFGFPAQGIWPEGADGTDINACGRSRDSKLIATGDDFGEVKLFKYPCVKLKAEGNPGVGHSSHVTCVRFTANDTSLISVGGQDCSIMQWSLQ